MVKNCIISRRRPTKSSAKFKSNSENTPNSTASAKKGGAATTGNNSPIYQESVINNYTSKVEDSNALLGEIRAAKLDAEN